VGTERESAQSRFVRERRKSAQEGEESRVLFEGSKQAAACFGGGPCVEGFDAEQQRQVQAFQGKVGLRGQLA